MKGYPIRFTFISASALELVAKTHKILDKAQLIINRISFSSLIE